MDKRVIRFDGWKVDFSSGELSKDGTALRLQDQALQILEELLRQPGEVVTREQLIARLWPTGVVEFDTGLNSAMRKLRSALGDDAETPRYIETLPRKGYRFVGRIEEDTSLAGVPRLPGSYIPTPFETGEVIGRRSSDRKAPIKRLAWGFGALVLAAVLGVVAWRMPGNWFAADAEVTKLPTIVVLPLVDMSVAKNEQAICDGLTEELSNWLAHIPTLRVVARTSAFAFQGKNIDVRDIARQLGASHVLEGSLRRSGEELRITVQLIAATDGVHMWSNSFNLPLGNIFEIEDTVARSVAEALHIQLSPEVGEQWKERRSQSTNGFELYLLARDRQRLRTAADNLKAEEFFQRAIAADPQFTPALTGLAETYLNGLSLNRAAIEDVKAKVEPLIHRASQLSPNSAHVLAVQGWLLNEELRFDEALPLLQKAVKLNPNDASSHRFLGDLFDRRAQPDEALVHYSAAASLNPMDHISHVFRCIELVDLADLEAATAACQRARELEPKHLWGPLATAWIERARGNTSEALRWIDEARKLAPGDTWLADQKIELLLTLRKHEEARAVVREIPRDGSFFSLAREAAIEFSEGGSAALKTWMADHPMGATAGTGIELGEYARMQYLSGDAVAARATLEHAQRILKLTSKDLYDGGQIRHEYSAALVHARILLSGGGDRAQAMKLLDDFDAMLATYEKNGGRHFGLYSLRAESQALRGDKSAVEKSLQEAWDHGWRARWRAERDPLLVGVKLPGH